MPVQGMGFVLDQHGNFPNVRIETIAQGEIDHSVFAAERNGRLRAELRERAEPFAFPAGENHGKDALHGRILTGRTINRKIDTSVIDEDTSAIKAEGGTDGKKRS